MGTRSNIIAQMSDGTWASIYCHWDGYVSHNGEILQNHYDSQDKVEQLIALGDLSSLAPEIGEKHPFEQATNKEYDNWCCAYGRDRNETDCQAQTGVSFYDVLNSQEYVYVWFENKWWIMNRDNTKCVLLASIIENEDEDENFQYSDLPWRK